MMILTIDFGTTVTKVGLWSDEGLQAMTRSEVPTSHPQVGWAEQEPLRWWTSVVIACAEARALAPEAFSRVDVVACSGARQTFVPVTRSGDPIGKGILWSDRRGIAEAALLNEAMGGEAINRARTGIPLDAGAVASKLAWVAHYEPERLAACDAVLSPRDMIILRMTDELVTDATFASRSGLYDFDGNAVRELAGPALGKLPSVVSSDTVVGQLRAVPGAELGLKPGIPVVIGAGDRQCEVLGSGASEGCPMVSWGTTANVSVPVHERPVPSPAGAVVTRGAAGGWLLEGGLSAAGSFLAWLGRLLNRPADELAKLASESPPGARGVIAVPWLDGARAPWWRDDARAGFVGLGSAHGAADLSRAVVEAVAWDVLRCMEVVTAGRLGGSTAQQVTLGGAGTGLPLWVEVLTSVLGVPATRHRSGEAASAGAALLAGRALGMGLTLEHLDPVVALIEPDPAAVEVYRALRPQVEHVAQAVLAATATLPRAASGPGR
jgi:xylulokinase